MATDHAMQYDNRLDAELRQYQDNTNQPLTRNQINMAQQMEAIKRTKEWATWFRTYTFNVQFSPDARAYLFEEFTSLASSFVTPQE